MEHVIADILDALRAGELDGKQLDRIVRAGSKRLHDGRRRIAKKHVLPFYLAARAEAGALWESWNVDDDLDRRFVKALQMKPRRTASGVATITVITKPWPCANSCVYCPNDPAMPKSYLSDEPACQRAERNRFDPYLQVASRMRTLHQMGHATDKIELIVLGGTWLDYPRDYRTWFVCELYRALNDSDDARKAALEHIDDGHPREGAFTLDDVRMRQAANERAAHRVVGLVFETRPDTIDPGALTEFRACGCTKIQLGVQSIDDGILQANGRRETASLISDAFMLCRLFGFKIHAHFMLNLLGATPASDVRGYRSFMSDGRFAPDEVKLYPCALVAGTQLVEHYEDGSWKPYSEGELVDVLSQNLLDTPPHVRVSRMIRDISAKDIMAGNRKTNLRQLVERHLAEAGAEVDEIRYREVGTADADFGDLSMRCSAYETRGTTEHFLQWVDSNGTVFGFLRLSLPDGATVERLGDALPIRPGEAMVREVHVYGFATQIARAGASAQHRGLGSQLIERACEIARDAGYSRLNVISAVGTREYYRNRGFADNGLYQQRDLSA